MSDKNVTIALPPGFEESLIASMSRRSLIKSGLIAGTSALAFLSAPRAAFAAQSLPAGIKHLSPLEYRVFDRMRQVLLPVERFGMPSTTTVPVMQNIDDLVGQIGAFPRGLLTMGIRGFELSSVGRFKRFSSLDNDAAYRHVEAWQSGLFFQRGFMSNIKSLTTFAYWRDERTWTALEYEGAVTEKWGIRRLGNAPMPRDEA